ncbi:MAG TPA: hypothetical protein VHN20_13065 [Beijerinckiaceae bacterium]|nr:hypothetical protein [Beijerinckiaceae bacterium]
MPVLLAIVGAVATGLFYWLIWGRGLEYVEHRWRASTGRRRDARRRSAAIEQQRVAPLRAIADPRDAAIVLMLTVARQRGVPTPEQIAVVERCMREVLGFGADVTERRTAAAFAAEQVVSAEDALDHLAPVLRARLTGAERAELLDMLAQVAAVHDGPTYQQQRVIDLTERQLAAG